MSRKVSQIDQELDSGLCPLCGKPWPHDHTEKQIAEWEKRGGTRGTEEVRTLVPLFRFPNSTRVRAIDFEQDWFKGLAKDLGQTEGKIHRKIWEFVAIAQVFNEQSVDGEALYSANDVRRKMSMEPIKPKVLGFGCGKEPLPKWFLDEGCEVIASDAPGNNPSWANSGQLSKSLADLGIRGGASDLPIEFREIDMNSIPDDLLQGQFDFTWSCGSFEHIGGLEKSTQFFCNQMRCLKPGGIACHTTEFNFNSNTDFSLVPDPTINAPDLCLFRYRDLVELAGRLWLQGDRLFTPDLAPGDQEADRFVDSPPYNSDTHLNIQIGPFQTTSILLIAQRGGM